MKVLVFILLFVTSHVHAAKWHQDSYGNCTFSTLPEWFDTLDTCKAAHPTPKNTDFYQPIPCGPGHPYFFPSTNDP